MDPPVADNILKQLYKNTENVSKDIKSMDTTLSKLLKLEKKQEKFDKTKDKEETKAKKKAARNEKRKKADFQGFKGIVKMKKSEKDKEKKSLMDLLMGGIGTVVNGITTTIKGLVSTVSDAIGGIGSAIISAIGGLGLGAMLSGALGVVAPVLLAAVAAAGAAALMNPDVQKFIDNHIGKKLDQMGLGWMTQNNRAGEQGYTPADARAVADQHKRRGTSSQATEADRTKYRAMDNIAKSRREIADLGGAINHAEQRVLDLQRQIELDKTKVGLSGETIDPQENLDAIEEQKKKIEEDKKKIAEREIFIASTIRVNDLASVYEEIGWTKRQVGGHINVPGSGEGDKVPMLLPQGSFVLNKMASMHFQTGGMVPTLLEPGEKVFAPGQWDDTITTLNSMIPRFQTGGVVEHLHGDPHRNGYDHQGHGTEASAHDHFAFSSEQLRIQVQEALASGKGPSGRSWQIGSTTGGQHAPNSYHYSGQAFDVPWSQFGSGAIGQKDYEQSRQLAKDVGALIEEFGGTAQGIQQEAGGNIQATARQAMGGMADMAGGIGDIFKGAFEHLSAFGEGFMGGFGNTVDQSNPIIGMISSAIGGVSSSISSIGDLFGGDGGNPFSNLFGGSGSSSPSGGTGPVDMGPDTNAKLKKMAEYAMEAGFTKDQAKTMAAIAGGESTFNNRAHNPNRATGDNSYGLWQINMIDQLGVERRRQLGISSNEDLFDPKVNARAAKMIFDSQGFGAWGAYKDGNANKYMNAAQAMKLQRGGLVPSMQQSPTSGRLSRKPSDLALRMQKAQAQFSQGVSLSVKPIVVYDEEPAAQVSSTADVAPMPPNLPDGPGTAMAADYFYQLSLGNQ